MKKKGFQTITEGDRHQPRREVEETEVHPPENIYKQVFNMVKNNLKSRLKSAVVGGLTGALLMGSAGCATPLGRGVTAGLANPFLGIAEYHQAKKQEEIVEGKEQMSKRIEEIRNMNIDPYLAYREQVEKLYNSKSTFAFSYLFYRGDVNNDGFANLDELVGINYEFKEMSNFYHTLVLRKKKNRNVKLKMINADNGSLIGEKDFGIIESKSCFKTTSIKIGNDNLKRVLFEWYITDPKGRKPEEIIRDMVIITK